MNSEIPHVRQAGYLPFLFVLLFSVNQLLSAQDIKVYDSVYKPASAPAGHATFEYYLNKKGEKVRQGDFHFHTEVKDSTTQSAATVIQWTGQYEQDRKSGEWKYDRKAHTVKIKNLTENTVDYVTSTKETHKRLSYKNGYPDGSFTYESEVYEDKNLLGRPEFLTANFKDKKIHGDFEVRFLDKDQKEIWIKGKASEGLMDGAWEFWFEKEEIKEIRNYKQGILLTLTRWKGNDTIQHLEFPQSEMIQKALETEGSEDLINAPLSLLYSDGYPRTSAYITSQTKGEKVLDRALKTIFTYDREAYLDNGLPLGTNRAFYPLTSEEKEQLDSWKETEAAFREKISGIQNREIDNLTFVKDEVIQKIIGWAKKQDSLINYIKPWNDILLKEQIEYYNREGLLIDYAQQLLSHDTITTTSDSYIFHYEPKQQEKPNFLSYIVENFEDRTRVADSLTEAFDQKVEELHLEREVMNLNKKIVAESKTTDTLYAEDLANSELQDLLMQTKNYYSEVVFERKFNEFISEADDITKRQKGEAIVADFEILEEAHQIAEKIEERSMELDTLYTEYVFDPFTYSDQVPARKKKRLYNAVVNDMIPQLIGIAKAVYQQPTEVLKRLNTIHALQERLFFLEDKNTIKLERKLRRNKSLEERLQILNAW